MLRRFVAVWFWGSLLLLLISAFMRESLLGVQQWRPELAQAPVQDTTYKAPFTTRVKGIDYRIQPRFDYDLYGLVVSRHDSDAWWDYVHRESNDNLNLMDLCVVWGHNLKNGVFRKLDYHNDQWTCWVSSGNGETWQQFDGSSLSNNHILTDQHSLARQLRKVRIGDQIRLQGYLADYTTVVNGNPTFTRRSSTVRTDTGNGACEVFFVESMQLLEAGNRDWRILFWVMLVLFPLSIVAWFLRPAHVEEA
ncbi:hypothetical protein [Leeia aquatica]|uniref:Uncharacterized protein n=1 Tax=Leeia aquatica TaxID=2725557 RepID=A0A847RW19_9NEIS|nr:hypothetical protein [Leeia aquatica]NLR74011.1 hypothetical protein [Leeia aquatica]